MQCRAGEPGSTTFGQEARRGGSRFFVLPPAKTPTRAGLVTRLAAAGKQHFPHHHHRCHGRPLPLPSLRLRKGLRHVMARGPATTAPVSALNFLGGWPSHGKSPLGFSCPVRRTMLACLAGLLVCVRGSTRSACEAAGPCSKTLSSPPKPSAGGQARSLALPPPPPLGMPALLSWGRGCCSL